MFEVPADDQSDNKENVNLRSTHGDSNRHTPMADHYPLSDYPPSQIPATSMYTLETRYQPIPAKALPKANDPRVYYMESDRRTPMPMPAEQPAEVPTAFLEPKVISQPIFYSVAGAKTSPVPPPLGSPIPRSYDPTPPTVYSIVDRPRRPTVDMSTNNVEVPRQINDNAPTVYSIIGSPSMRNANEEPINQPVQSPPNIYDIPANQQLQTAPNFYSLIGSPARTSRGTQVNTLDPQEPSPILYTILGDTPNQTSRINEKDVSQTRKPPPPADVAFYTLGNHLTTPRAPEQEQEQQQPIHKPLVYTLVDGSYSPPVERRAKPAPATKKNTSPPTTTTQRSSRSLERKPEAVHDEMITYPVIQSKPQTIHKEPKFPKSETTIIPANGEERRARPPPSYQNNSKPYAMVEYPPIQLPDYRSPYAARTYKPYRQRKFNNEPLPIINHSHSDRKGRPALYEPRYRVEKHHPYNSTKPTSLERYPVNTKPSSNLWDTGYQTQTDDEEYDQRINRKKHNYKTSRTRAPWIPVW